MRSKPSAGKAIYTMFIHSTPYRELLNGGHMGIALARYFKSIYEVMGETRMNVEQLFYEYIKDNPEDCPEYLALADLYKKSWPSVDKLYEEVKDNKLNFSAGK
jgi:hypothetical protein